MTASLGIKLRFVALMPCNTHLNREVRTYKGGGRRGPRRRAFCIAGLLACGSDGWLCGLTTPSRFGALFTYKNGCVVCRTRLCRVGRGRRPVLFGSALRSRLGSLYYSIV